jgi:hypothetical protein
MEDINIKEILLEQFEDDPLYRLAIRNDLEDNIFSDSILSSLHPGTTYSTVETGRMIDRSDSTIRNHFRTDLIEYIAPEKYGKFYRLDYKSVFRLHLIFLLNEKAGKNTIDLLAELGMQPGITVAGNVKRIGRSSNSSELQEYNDDYNNNFKLENRISELEEKFNLQSLMLNILKYEKDISDFERKINSEEAKIAEIKSNIRVKYLEDKQSLLLTNSLKNSLKPSLFGFLKKNDSVDIQKFSSEIDSQLKEKYEKEINDKISEHEMNIRQFIEAKQRLELSLGKEKKQLETHMEINEDKQRITAPVE